MDRAGKSEQGQLYTERANKLQAKIHGIVESYGVARPELHKPSTEISILIARVYNLVKTLFNGYTTERGLTHAKFTTLLLLFRTPGNKLRMYEISAENHVTRTNITKLVDGLENEGFVARLKDPTDRRSALIHLTHKGKEFVQTHLHEYLELQRWMFNELTPSEQETLIAILYKLLISLSNKAEETRE
ncbi:MarR family winged helix-turn-helix transcriptional regulator [Alicyclobacillus shizuokensis]|uniref:MarR family winged helix-turn-helix transcriptional regulator n=1 Tax=Alicyclobacillus shizuokensis TaxID=392014 RepID=UPI001FE131C4|nr:MarR family transcriptional regulator [Alicyclobacillus shizuokensis]